MRAGRQRRGIGPQRCQLLAYRLGILLAGDDRHTRDPVRPDGPRAVYRYDKRPDGGWNAYTAYSYESQNLLRLWPEFGTHSSAASRADRDGQRGVSKRRLTVLTRSPGGPITSATPSLIRIDVEPNTPVHHRVRHIVVVIRVASAPGIRQFRHLLDDDLCPRRTRIEHFLKRPDERPEFRALPRWHES